MTSKNRLYIPALCLSTIVQIGYAQQPSSNPVNNGTTVADGDWPRYFQDCVGNPFCGDISSAEWLFLISGAASVVCGLFLFFMPGSGALAVLFWIGAYAVTIGFFLVVVAFRLRRWVAQPIEQPSR